MSRSSLLKPARLLHLYLGVFTAPALIFFAITGGLQTFSLHETTRGRDYTPPKILVQLGQLHKKQTLVVANKKPQPPVVAKPAAEKPPAEVTPVPPRPAEAAPAKVKNLLPMKIFFLIVAIGLLLSTLTGIYMSYKYVRNKTVITALLLAGIIIPILLTFL
ncbi:hypothetical protein BH10ACI4_BH10ACI4_02570 [soil metagenome]